MEQYLFDFRIKFIREWFNALLRQAANRYQVNQLQNLATQMVAFMASKDVALVIAAQAKATKVSAAINHPIMEVS